MSDNTNPAEGGDSWREQRRAERHQRRMQYRAWREQHWESRIFGALSVIIIGVIFLFNTTGILPWGVWTNILSYWPLFIVSAGVSIIFSGHGWLRLIGSAISFFIFLAILWLAIFNPFNTTQVNFIPFVNNSAPTQESIDTVKLTDYPDVKTQTLTAVVPAGEVKISDSGTTDFLSMTSDYFTAAEKPVITKVVSQGNLGLTIGVTQANSMTFDFRGPRYTIMLGQPTVPTSLDLKFGAGSGTLALDKQMVKDLNVEVGAGSLDMQFSSVSLPTQNFSLKSGLGSVRLVVPASVGLKINYKVGLGSLNVDGTAVTNGVGSSTFYSRNYNTASANVTINVEVGLGSIDIVTN